MDFPLNWTLDDAREFTRPEYDAVIADPESDKAKARLARKGEKFTKSILALNEKCMKELSAYRESVVNGRPVEEQEELLRALYKRYKASV